MSKKYKHIIFTLSLAIIFSFGSMAGMKLTLQIRERQLLTESGRIVIETPVRSLQTVDNKEGEDEKEENEITEKERYMLTTEQMEEVMRLYGTYGDGACYIAQAPQGTFHQIYHTYGVNNGLSPEGDFGV